VIFNGAHQAAGSLENEAARCLGGSRNEVDVVDHFFATIIDDIVEERYFAASTISLGR
jgi:uncharacterized membrane protein YjdF